MPRLAIPQRNTGKNSVMSFPHPTGNLPVQLAFRILALWASALLARWALDWTLMKSFCLLLTRKTLLRHSGTPSWPLELKTSSSPNNSTLPLEATALPQRQPLCGSFASLRMHSPDQEIFFWLHCPCPSLTVSISMSLSSATTQEIDLLMKSNCTSVFSKPHRPSSYNPLLRLQRPRLDLNLWLRLTRSWSVWVLRSSTP